MTKLYHPIPHTHDCNDRRRSGCSEGPHTLCGPIYGDLTQRQQDLVKKYLEAEEKARLEPTEVNRIRRGELSIELSNSGITSKICDASLRSARLGTIHAACDQCFD